jgi:saccharopine dehydrogenase (NAD+, L-lysine-forming)
MVGAQMILEKHWTGTGVVNVETLNPDPFLAELAKQGLPWHVQELPVNEAANADPLAA